MRLIEKILQHKSLAADNVNLSNHEAKKTSSSTHSQQFSYFYDKKWTKHKKVIKMCPSTSSTCVQFNPSSCQSPMRAKKFDFFVCKLISNEANFLPSNFHFSILFSAVNPSPSSTLLCTIHSRTHSSFLIRQKY